MPTIGVKKSVIDRHFGRVYTEEEFDNLCFEYGLELDEITSEKAAVEKERGAAAAANLSNEEIYKIEIPANRYDLLCIEGLARAMKVFKGEKQPRYHVDQPAQLHKLYVKKEVAEVRPFVVAAILRDITFDADSYASFIDLQDKLHQNICRKRTLASMGTHDLDTIEGPFTYTAEDPKSINFVPLNQTKSYRADELLNTYATDPLYGHLKPYVPIIQDKPAYPVIRDKNGKLCSLPPIINSDHSKISLKTKNVFIEVTATDLQKAVVVLDTIVAMFSQYAKKQFTVEPVEVIYESDGHKEVYPKLAYRTQRVTVDRINNKMGVNLDAPKIGDLLTRMGLEASVIDANTVEVTIPPNRHDILHECDVAEDVGIAFGYNNLVPKLPESNTVAQPFELNAVSDLLRAEVAMAGWTEALNFALCSRDDVSTKLRDPAGLDRAVKISNPKTFEFQVARTTLLPGLLKTLASNRDMALPLKLFECQDTILKDDEADTGAKNERRLAAVYCNKAAGFEIMHGFLDRVMRLLDVNPAKDGSGYHIEAEDAPSFFPGRCAAVYGPRKVKIGHVGVLHPEVLAAFGISLPVTALEINLEPFI
ncbi:unnamed protein product, partial [Mesorhabditis spiculigera]